MATLNNLRGKQASKVTDLMRKLKLNSESSLSNVIDPALLGTTTEMEHSWNLSTVIEVDKLQETERKGKVQRRGRGTSFSPPATHTQPLTDPDPVSLKYRLRSDLMSFACLGSFRIDRYRFDGAKRFEVCLEKRRLRLGVEEGHSWLCAELYDCVIA